MHDDRLTIALAHGHRSGARAAVLLIDVDRLSAINNTLGHAAGDAVLRATASRLQSRLRATDTLARVGGDEFAVAITNLRQEEDAVRLAQGLMRQFSEPLIALGQELYVSVSVGIAIFPHDGHSASRLFGAADDALREARHAGGNSWHLHESSASDRALERLAVEMDLR